VRSGPMKKKSEILSVLVLLSESRRPTCIQNRARPNKSSSPPPPCNKGTVLRQIDSSSIELASRRSWD
jgi:hypothetical protein